VEEAGKLPTACADRPELANCTLVVMGEFCNANEWYPRICCESCTRAGQIVPETEEEEEETGKPALPSLPPPSNE